MTDRNQPPETVSSLRRTRQASLEDVVLRLADIHSRIARHYKHLHEHTTQERVQLMLEFLAGEESALAVYLHRFVEDAPDTVVRRRFKYVPDLEGDDLFVAIESRRPETPEELAELVNDIHKSIDAVYEPLDESSLPEEVSEAVEKLRQQEREHVIEQLRATKDE